MLREELYAHARLLEGTGGNEAPVWIQYEQDLLLAAIAEALSGRVVLWDEMLQTSPLCLELYDPQPDLEFETLAHQSTTRH